MAQLLNPSVLSTFLFYIAPGVVATRFYTLFNRSEKRNYGDLAVEFITFSMFYLTISFWLIDIVNKLNIISDEFLHNFLVFITVFVIPAIIGSISAIVPKRQWFRNLLKITYHPTPNAWDHIFGDKNTSYWILFSLKTGERLGGVYRGKSFASSFPQQQDIYVEELWELDSEGKFIEKVDKTAGCYVRVDDCKFIQFFEH